MKLNIPYFPQRNLYYCGPATLQMVLAFFGKNKSQRKIARVMKASTKKLKATGLDNHKLVEAALRLKYFCYVNEGSTLDEIKYFLNLGLPVIVNYNEPTTEEGHFAIVSGYRRLTRRIIFNDPYNGKGFSLPDKEFLKRWHGTFQGKQRWMLVISKKPFNIGKQFLPRKERP